MSLIPKSPSGMSQWFQLALIDGSQSLFHKSPLGMIHWFWFAYYAVNQQCKISKLGCMCMCTTCVPKGPFRISLGWLMVLSNNSSRIFKLGWIRVFTTFFSCQLRHLSIKAEVAIMRKICVTSETAFSRNHVTDWLRPDHHFLLRLSHVHKNC